MRTYNKGDTLICKKQFSVWDTDDLSKKTLIETGNRFIVEDCIFLTDVSYEYLLVPVDSDQDTSLILYNDEGIEFVDKHFSVG